MDKSPQLQFFIRKFFDPKIYCAYKALQFFQQKANGGFSSKTIRSHMPQFSSAVGKAILKSGLDPWQHYTLYGTQEGINPSDFFDTKAYLTEKAKIWTKNGRGKKGKGCTIADVARDLKTKGLNALEDFLLHAGTGPDEVRETLTEDGGIPAIFTVPAKYTIHKIPEISAKTFFNAAEYVQFKAVEFFGREENGGIGRETVLRHPETYVPHILRIFHDLNMTPWEHFQKYGTVEHLNPSNAFDTEKYLSTKVRVLRENGVTDNGRAITATDVAEMISSMQMTVLDHFLVYAGKGKDEVPAGLNADGSIPDEFRVNEPVGTVNLKKMQRKIDSLPPVISMSLPEIVQPTVKNEEETIEVQAVAKKKPSFKSLYLFLLFGSTAFVFLYLFLIASPAYISEMKFAVKGQENASGVGEGLGAILNISTPTQNDSYILLDYIQSANMIMRLDRQLNITGHFSDRSKDIWYRLEKNPTKDVLVQYWQWVCQTSYDPDTNILSVKIKAFTPEMALALCQAILKESERLVNEMNARARKDTMDQARNEVKLAEKRLEKARVEIRTFRDKTVMLDPGSVATGLYSIVNELEKELTAANAELSQMQTYMSEQSPRMRQMKNRIVTLEKQLDTEKRRLAGKVKENASLNDVLSDFQSLTQEEEFAKQQLTQAMTSLETARVRADSKTQYVEAFEEPTLADESLYPRPFLFTFIYWLTALLLSALMSLIVAAVREHLGW